MSITQAQRQAADLRTALLDNGVKAVSIELQPGVGPKADPWAVDTFVRGLGHHIVSRPPGTPGLGLVKAGRTGKNALGGPLCNGYGGFDEVARIITMGWANHPGEGGPWAVDGWGTVPRNDGRPRIFGWEFEGGIDPWTDSMHEFMARCGAGTLDWLGTLNRREPAPLECWGEHGHPWAEGRKIDRLGYTAASGRARIADVRGTSTTPTLRQLRRTPMYLVRDPRTGGVYLITDAGVRALQSAEEHACFQWLIDDDRDPDIDAKAVGLGDTPNFNTRFFQVIIGVLSRPVLKGIG